MSIKRTKIICSIGPATETEEVLTKLAKEGMNVVRLNFSHGNYEEYTMRKELVEKVRKNTGYHIGLLYDTKGPDFRTLEMENNGVELIDGKTIRIVKEDVIGNSERISVNYKNVLDKLNPGDTILFDDGLMNVKVKSREEDGVTCEIIHGGILSSRKGVATPGVSLDIPFLSEQDKKDIKFACENDGDFIALSFVTCKKDIEDVRKLLKENKRSDMKIISKVESRTAINNLDEIVAASDGIMVARGDLGVEVAIVVGGGNFWRGRSNMHMDRCTSDYIGMLATTMNALALGDAFKQLGQDVRVQTGVEMRQVAEFYIKNRADRHLDKGRVVIFGCGTGSPFFSTDTAAALRSAEINADAVLKATNVDGIYTADPRKDENATLIKEVTYMEVLNKKLNVMDSTATTLCMDNDIPIIVFNINNKGNLLDLINGKDIGTLVSNK